MFWLQEASIAEKVVELKQEAVLKTTGQGFLSLFS